jgi:hypothetical protein
MSAWEYILTKLSLYFLSKIKLGSFDFLSKCNSGVSTSRQNETPEVKMKLGSLDFLSKMKLGSLDFLSKMKLGSHDFLSKLKLAES